LREGKNLKGHLLGFVLETIGRSVLEKAFVNSIKAIEARILLLLAQFGKESKPRRWFPRSARKYWLR
jgi:hypothetical protein